jgi:ubiquinone/menaquinone biosynthesis C-methylase UbiE
MTANDQVLAGQAVYTPLTLRAYDAFVLGLSNHLLWRCPTSELRALYARNVTDRHLDIGVGTGYFLDKVRWPSSTPSITLLDLNRHSLDAAARRIARYKPETVVADILAPLPTLGPFDSAGVNYLLHCLPGAIAEKAVIFDNLRPVLSPGARIFGATILQGDAPRSRAAQALMNFYNRKGVFSNAKDTYEDLEAELRLRFKDLRLQRHGAVAIFEARAAS